VPTPRAAVDSNWYRPVEGLAFLTALLLGTAFTAAVVSFDGMLSLLWLVFVLLPVVGLASAVLIPVCLYLDAQRVGAAGCEWNPSGGLYAAVGVLFSLLVGAEYLYRRHRHVHTDGVAVWPAVAVVAVLVLAWPAGFAADAFVGPLLLTGGLALGLLPTFLYLDAAHVRSRTIGGEAWSPNPVNYFVGTLFGAIIPFVPLLVAGYYLYRRHGAVGTP
jgi:hypothetical protein